MLLAAVTSALLCAATPAPAPPADAGHLKTIEHITTSAVCSALRQNIAQSVLGLRADDGIIQQGAVLMQKSRYDAANEPQSASPVGGAGAAAEMDDLQLEHLVQSLAQNLARIEALLSDPQAFPASDTSEGLRALALAKARLEAVAAAQRRLLDTLSGSALSNEASDLASKCDPVDCPKGGAAPARFNPTRALAAQLQEEQQAETQVAQAVVAVIDLCRKTTQQ